MKWEDTAPGKAINFGVAYGVPDQPTLYRVCILRVPKADPLPPAFAEFWRRVLADGPQQCSDRWEVLLFQMDLLGGGFTCAFTDRELKQDEPPIFKLSSAALEAKCRELPEREPGDPREESEYKALEAQCLNQLQDALRVEPAVGHFRELRDRRAFAVLACDFCRAKTLVLDW